MYYLLKRDGVYMAGWDFTVDSEIQADLADKINTSADNFDTKVESMYSSIDSLGAHWVGEDYDAYKVGVEGYKTALKDLSDGMRMFGTHFKKMSEGTVTLATDLLSIASDPCRVNVTSTVAVDGTTTPGQGTDPIIGGSAVASSNNGDQNAGDDGTTGKDGEAKDTGNAQGGVPANEQGDESVNDTSASEEQGSTQGVALSTDSKVNVGGNSYSVYGTTSISNTEYLLLTDASGNLYSCDINGTVLPVKATIIGKASGGARPEYERDATLDLINNAPGNFAYTLDNLIVDGGPVSSSSVTKGDVVISDFMAKSIGIESNGEDIDTLE